MSCQVLKHSHLLYPPLTSHTFSSLKGIVPPCGTVLAISQDPVACSGFSSGITNKSVCAGAATPHFNGSSANTQIDRPNTTEEDDGLEKKASLNSQRRNSSDRKSDYFTTGAQAKSPVDGPTRGPLTPGDTSLDGSTLALTQSPVEGDRDEKTKESGIFGKSFRMKFPKKLGRPSTEVKSATVDEKSEESDVSEEKEDKTIQDNLYGTIQRIRYQYEEQMQTESFHQLMTGIRASSLNETPELQLPPFTTVIIQDERPDSGGVADLYRGTVSSVGYDADLIEKVAPMWLGELLLKVRCNSRCKSSFAISWNCKIYPLAQRRSPISIV